MLYYLLTVLLTFSRCFLALRDQLMDAVVIADAERVDQLLAYDPLILSSNNPIIAVDSRDENFGRSAIMVSSVHYEVRVFFRLNIDILIGLRTRSSR